MFYNDLEVSKGINWIVVLILFSFALIGCDGFLTRTPDNVLSTEEFYSNEDHAEQAVIGVYEKLADVYGGKWRYTELRSDNTTHQWWEENRGPHFNWEIDEWSTTTDNPIFEGGWSNFYEGIQRSNTFLNNVDDVEFSDTDVKDKLRGEVKFLRAFFYFDLVRLFGGVPLVTEQVQTPDQALATAEERADPEEIYSQIIEDAEDAADLLPRNNPGRATEGAARTLLGKVYLTRGNYQEAVTNLRAVTKMGYELLSDYSAIYDLENKGHNESVFDVQYVELESDRGLGSNFMYNFAPLYSGSEITGDNASTPTGLNIPSRCILDAYESGDERKSASISFWEDPVNKERFPGLALGDSMPYVEKYNVPHSVRGVTGANWPVYRYAEVLLMLGEALNELGRTDEAYPHVNRVRRRAGLDDLPAGLTQSQFREAVYHEQRVELAFENDRWFNLLRTDRAIEVMERHGNVHRGIQPHWREPAYEISEHKLTYPIPQRIITLNPDLEQNPGW
jgi:tetratricopeptide (TPR) repeat protein